MTELLSVRHANLDVDGHRVVDVLEAGGLVLLPDTPFAVESAEQSLLDPTVLAQGSKNVSLNASGKLGGVAVKGEAREAIARMTRRYARFADALIARVAPGYCAGLARRRTSFRPGAVATRALSARKDDRRLHVDAFPSSPVAGRRILRVFSNVDPSGDVRTWRVGDVGFEAFAREFAPRLRGRSAVLRRMMAAVGITRGYRTDYDQAMLELHDSAKLDDAWQAQAPFRQVDFPAGSSWIVYTDAVLHAAIAGRHAFEQTYLLASEALRFPERSPLRVLERETARRLV